jgi:serine O-acetyltransferase
MIETYHDFCRYLESDRRSLNRKTQKPPWNDEVWKFQILLRTCEYLQGNKLSLPMKAYRRYMMYRLHRQSCLLGFTIPLNVCGPGLAIVHRGTIVISAAARLGANCRIHAGVNIGKQAGTAHGAPQIGNNVYIGPGAKVFGGITIADNVAVGANAVVNKSIIESGITVAGVPAKKVSDRGSQGYLFYGETGYAPE